MSSLRLVLAALLAVFALARPATADLTALARLDPGASQVVETGAGLEVALALSQPVPWRVFTLDEPRRLVLDLSEAAWPAALPVETALVEEVRMGVFKAGWSRMVIGLAEPLAIHSAAMETGAADGSATLRVTLAPVSAGDFAARSGTPGTARTLPRAAPAASPTRPPADRPLRVMLDPGHGGVDPGAEAGGLVEAELMLTFARELRETLLRKGGFEVAMTRSGDTFVPLETRITLARDFRADVLVSLHADALPEDAGHASGATVYTLADDASDRASRLLAERHDQADLITGLDLAGQGDEIALVLMDLARRDTAPRAARLAETLVEEIRAGTGHVNGRPHRQAAFSVLKAPDIPSVLVELGFLSSKADRARLADPGWRAAAAAALARALRRWAEDEALRPALARAE